MTNSAETFIKNASSIMERSRISQRALAGLMGVSHPMVQQYLAGKSAPGLGVLEKFAACLGVQPWELIRPADTDETKTPLAQGVRQAIREELSGHPVPAPLRPLLPRLAALDEDQLEAIVRNIANLLTAFEAEAQCTQGAGESPNPKHKGRGR